MKFIAGFACGVGVSAYAAVSILDRIIPGTKNMIKEAAKRTAKEIANDIKLKFSDKSSSKVCKQKCK